MLVGDAAQNLIFHSLESGIWMIIGFIVGLFGSVILARHNRFRASREACAKIIRGQVLILSRGATETERLLIVPELYKDVEFELALQSQQFAIDDLAVLKEKISECIKIGYRDANLPEHDRLRTSLGGDIEMVANSIGGNLLITNRLAHINAALSLKADWLVIFLGGNLGWRTRTLVERAKCYLELTGELKK